MAPCDTRHRGRRLLRGGEQRQTVRAAGKPWTRAQFPGGGRGIREKQQVGPWNHSRSALEESGRRWENHISSLHSQPGMRRRVPCGQASGSHAAPWVPARSAGHSRGVCTRAESPGSPLLRTQEIPEGRAGCPTSPACACPSWCPRRDPRLHARAGESACLYSTSTPLTHVSPVLTGQLAPRVVTPADGVFDVRGGGVSAAPGIHAWSLAPGRRSSRVEDEDLTPARAPWRPWPIRERHSVPSLPGTVHSGG